MNSSTLFTTPLSRRQVGRLLAGGATAATLAVSTRSGSADAQEIAASGSYRTTTNLNLRTGPGTRRRVLLVIPQNGLVTDLGGNKNGFRQVSYKGTAGWASLAYLAVADGGANPDPVISGTARTTASVNFRSGPGTSSSVIRVLGAGTLVETTLTVQNGFRLVVHSDTTGWIYDELLLIEGDSPAPGTLVVTVALNLRAEPSTSAKILTVMAAGTTVTPTGQGSGQFVQVTYGSQTGWAAAAYLN